MNKIPYLLYDFRYIAENMGDNRIRVGGKVIGHPDYPAFTFIHISSPIEFDKNLNEITCISGNKYRIESFDGDETDWLDELYSEIESNKQKYVNP